MVSGGDRASQCKLPWASILRLGQGQTTWLSRCGCAAGSTGGGRSQADRIECAATPLVSDRTQASVLSRRHGRAEDSASHDRQVQCPNRRRNYLGLSVRVRCQCDAGIRLSILIRGESSGFGSHLPATVITRRRRGGYRGGGRRGASPKDSTCTTSDQVLGLGI